MFKTISSFVLGSLVAAAVGTAFAVQGVAPVTGFQTIDGAWINGVKDGINWSYQYNITAVGTNQATAVQLAANKYLQQVDTSGSGGATGVALPTCVQGMSLHLNNNTAYTIDVYPAVVNNPATAAQDTINNTTSTTITTYAAKTFSCAKSGTWSAQ
jgi:hypothetical protein